MRSVRRAAPRKLTVSRQLWVVVHRWAGLTIALFLFVVGATGALLPFEQPLTDLASPWERIAPPRPGAPTLDPLVLRAAAMRALPAANFEGLRLEVRRDHSLALYPSAKPGRTLGYDMVLLDPYSGAILHEGRYANLADGPSEIVHFLYRLHTSLALGAWGIWALGIASLVWTLDCFVGFYLTLPVGRRRWWRHWRKAWGMKLPARNGYRFSVDLHRAGGLWLWPLLLVFAWSGVGLNLPGVYVPVMRALGATPSDAALPADPAPPGFAPDWPHALEIARRLAALEGARAGFMVETERSLYFDATRDVFDYDFRSSRDIGQDGGSTLAFRPGGHLVALAINDGGPGGGGIDRWLMALHLAQVGGLPYRILVSFVGLLTATLSMTGVLVWMRKRSARLLHAGRRPTLQRPRAWRVARSGANSPPFETPSLPVAR